jgi:hypothetical protein
VEQIQELEAAQCSERNITDHSYFNKTCWPQWNFLAVRGGVLEHHWELAVRRTKTAQIVLPWRKVKEVTADHHGGP